MGKDRKYYLSISGFPRSVCRNAEHLVMFLYIMLSFAVSGWILTDLHRIVASNWIQNEVTYMMFSYETYPAWIQVWRQLILQYC